MSKKYIKQTEERTNYLTGEVTERVRHLVETTTAEKFIKVYLNFISGELNLKDYEKAFILEIFPRVNYETNKVTLLLDDKTEIANKLKRSVSHINNMITSLKKSNVLVQVSRGKYMLNPEYFFRGDEIQRGNIINIFKQYIIK